MIQFERAFTFFREDEKWQEKLTIGAALVLVSMILSPVLIGLVGWLIIGGYSIRLLQNVRDGHPKPLPEWGVWGEDLTRGFKLAVVYLVWALPLLAFMIPTFIGSALAERQTELIGVALLVCGNCLSALYGLFVSLASPGFMIAFAKDEEIRSGLDYRAVYDWTVANIGQVIIVVLVMLAVSAALSLLGMIAGLILCVVGLIATIPLAQLLTALVRSHLFGQLARNHPFELSAAASPSMDDYLASAVPPDMPMSGPGETPIDPIVDSFEETVEDAGDDVGDNVGDDATGQDA